METKKEEWEFSEEVKNEKENKKKRRIRRKKKWR